MSPRATDRADAARRPENAPVALVASAEKGTGPGHLAASPLRDRTNVRAAAAEASPSSDAVAESEEEDDSGPARSRRPFGVPVGAANRAVLEQMLRRDAPTRSALTRVSAEASPSGRGGAAEPPRARPTDESPVEPHQRESRRKRRRRRSPRGSREEEEEEDASMARRGKRRNASSPSFETAFEVADGAGDVSEHSDASHDRTAGVHGFNFQELRGDAYGRGRRRRDGGDADRVARRIAARRRGALEISSEDSDSDSDSDSDDATPLEPLEGDRARRVFLDAAGDDVDDADGIHVENENDARIRAGASSPRDSPDFPETFFPETRETRARGDFPARRRAKQTRLDAWAGREGGASRRVEPLRSEPRQTTDDEFLLRRRRRPHLGSLESEEAPRAFSLTLDAFDDERLRAARVLNARSSPGPDARLSASDRVRVAARLFRAHASCANGTSPHRDMSPADLAAWTRAAEACERESPGTGRFWQNVGACLAETRRRVCQGEEDTDTDTDTDPDMDPERVSSARRVRALEASWELLFVAARVWRSAEKEGLVAERRYQISADPETSSEIGPEGPSARGDRTAWAEPAWRAVSELLEASPLEDNDAVASAAAARVAALARAWPRCAAPAAAAWELWRRVARAGAPPRGAGKAAQATTEDEDRASAKPRGEYPATAAAAAAAAAAAVEGQSIPFVAETSAGAPRADQARASAASPFRHRFRVPCCEIPPPSSARPPRGAGRAALVPAASSACASALDALAAHVGAASDARDFRRDLGKALSAAAFPKSERLRDDEARRDEAAEAETNADAETKAFAKKKAFGGGDVSWDTARAAAVRHRAAAHARLVSACLERDMPDQAGACLRQMRAALAPGRCPAAARDPAPLAAAARAVGVAAEAWLACARRRGREAFAATRGADVLAREGEAVIDALAAAAAAASASETSTTVCLEPGTRLAARVGVVVAEASAAAATVFAALVASGAQPAGAAAAQTRFCAFISEEPDAEKCLFSPRAEDDSSSAAPGKSEKVSREKVSWPSRVFALRALAALLVPHTWVSLETSACVGAEALAPALAAWAASACADGAAGGVGPLAAALFAHPRLSRLNEGAAAGDADAAEAVARLQHGEDEGGGETSVSVVSRDRGVPSGNVPDRSARSAIDLSSEPMARESLTWRALRGGDARREDERREGAAPSTAPDARREVFFFGGAAAEEAARRRRERAAAACVGGVVGDAIGAREAAFRVSAGALVGAQLAACGAAGAAAIATLVARFPAAARSSETFSRVADESDVSSGVSRTTLRSASDRATLFDAARKDSAARAISPIAISHARVSCVAGAARWLAEAAARTAAAWPASLPEVSASVARSDADPTFRSVPALAFLAGAGGASFRTSPAFDLLRRDGRAGETARLAIAAAAARWAAADAARGQRGDGDGDGLAAFAAATRDVAACTVGVLEWTLGEDEDGEGEETGTGEGMMLDALASALTDERFEATSAAAAAAVLESLVPRFLAAETSPAAPQRRCARVWLSALALCRRLLAREDEARGADASAQASGRAGNLGRRNSGGAAAARTPGAARAAGLFSATLSTPGVMLLDVVANEGGGGVHHQAAAAVADLLGVLAARLDVASGVAKTTAPTPTTGGSAAAATPPPRPAAAAAASSGYFPFPGTAAAAAAAAARNEAAEREAARASAAAALEEARLIERRARESAEAREAAASLRAAADAAAESAASASLASPAAARLLGACATFAVVSLASVALAASASATTASHAFVSLGARRGGGGGGGGAPGEDSDRARAREVARARAALVLASDRAKARLAAEARDVARYDFSGARGLVGSGESYRGSTRLADLGMAVEREAKAKDAKTEKDADDGRVAFWGCAPVPPGAHRAPRAWSAASPEERSAKLARSAAAFLLALARRCARRASSETERDAPCVFAPLLAPHAETLARVASLLGEARDEKNAAEERRGVFFKTRARRSTFEETFALVAETLRLRRVEAPRIPSASSRDPRADHSRAAASRIGGRASRDGPSVAFGGRGGRARRGAGRGFRGAARF